MWGDFNYLRRQSVDEIAVVGDEEQGAIEGNQGIFQNFLAVDIQVVGRFVQNQGVVVLGG